MAHKNNSIFVNENIGKIFYITLRFSKKSRYNRIGKIYIMKGLGKMNSLKISGINFIDLTNEYKNHISNASDTLVITETAWNYFLNNTDESNKSYNLNIFFGEIIDNLHENSNIESIFSTELIKNDNPVPFRIRYLSMSGSSLIMVFLNGEEKQFPSD